MPKISHHPSADYVYEEELPSFPPPNSIRLAMMKDAEEQKQEQMLLQNVKIPPPAPNNPNAISPVPSITENVKTPPSVANSNLQTNPLHKLMEQANNKNANPPPPPMNVENNSDVSRDKLTEKIRK